MGQEIGAQFTQFFVPIIQVLRELGGSGKTFKVINLIIAKMDIPKGQQDQTLKHEQSKWGRSRVKNQIQWARFFLVCTGHLYSPERGTWSLTEKGMTIDLDNFNAVAFFRFHKKTLRKKHREN